MAEELEVKEITELNDVSFTDESLVLAYTEDEGVGKATFAEAKKAIGADISIEQTEKGTRPSAENRITATIRNGGTTETREFIIKNGTGLSAAAQEESTDENGLRSNTVSLESSDKTLVQDVNFTVKDGVGIRTHSQKEATDENGLRKNTLNVSYTNGESDSVEVKDGTGIRAHTQEESVDANGLRSNTLSLAYTDGGENTVVVKDGVGIKEHSAEKSTDENGRAKSTLNVSYTDGKTDTVQIADGIGIKSAAQTKASTLSGELNEYTVKLTDGTESKIKVYNGRAGKDFRIRKTYTSIAEMEADFSGDEVETYEFAMIDTGSVEDADTGKLYCKGETEWKYIGDLSGAQGIKGDTGNGIASVENSLTEEGKIKVAIKMTDGTSNEFLINNGLQYTAGDNVDISDSNEISVDLSEQNSNLSSLLAKIKKEAVLAAHPVGSLYWTSKNENPSVTFGGGTWKQIKDKFVLTAGDSYKADATGGASSMTLGISNIPSHSHSFTPSGTISMDAHSHGLNNHTHSFTPSGKIASTSGKTDNKTAGMSANSIGSWGTRVSNSKNQGDGSDRYTPYTSGNVSYNETKQRVLSQRPDDAYTASTEHYLTINVAHTHTAYFTGSTGTTDGNSEDTTTTTSTGKFSGVKGTTGSTGGDTNKNTTSFSILPPYVVKYCWERTA